MQARLWCALNSVLSSVVFVGVTRSRVLALVVESAELCCATRRVDRVDESLLLTLPARLGIGDSKV
jgi:hypothetical protein